MRKKTITCQATNTTLYMYTYPVYFKRYYMYNEIKMATTGIITCYSCKLKNLKTPVVLHLAVTCMYMSIIVQYVNTSFSFYNNHQSCKHVIIN